MFVCVSACACAAGVCSGVTKTAAARVVWLIQNQSLPILQQYHTLHFIIRVNHTLHLHGRANAVQVGVVDLLEGPDAAR